MVLSDLNKILKELYFIYKDDPQAPVPINTIKDFLEAEEESLKDNINTDAQVVKKIDSIKLMEDIEWKKK